MQDLDFDLLQNFAADSDGTARRIYVDSDAAQQLTGFFEEIASPLLSDVSVTYEPASVIHGVTRHSFPTIFAGTELVVAGRVADPSVETITATVSARSCGCSVMWQRRFNLTAAAEEPALINAEKVNCLICLFLQICPKEC